MLVALGVPPSADRLSYLTWREGRAPDFVLEVVSEGNWRNDYVVKRGIYERLGVAEYFVFDSRPRWDPVAQEKLRDIEEAERDRMEAERQLAVSEASRQAQERELEALREQLAALGAPCAPESEG